MPSLPSTRLTSLPGSSETKRLIAATALVVVALGAPAEAAAEPPSDIGAVDIYREAIPTITGGVVPDPKREQLATLAPGVELRLRAAGANGERLVRVAAIVAVRRAGRVPIGSLGPGQVSRDAVGPTVTASPIRSPAGSPWLFSVFVTATAVAVRARRGRASVLDEAHGSRPSCPERRTTQRHEQAGGYRPGRPSPPSAPPASPPIRCSIRA